MRWSILTSTIVAAALALLSIRKSAADDCTTLEKDIDYPGNDIKNFGGKKVSDCCALCKSTAGCKAFSFSDWNGGTCFLKSSKGTPKTVTGVQSAILKPLIPPDCNGVVIEEDTDYVDNDIKNVPGAVAENCCTECKKLADCKAFSWNNFNGGTCWLKSQKGQAIRSPGVRSAKVKPDDVDPSCKIEEDTDYIDNDMKNVPGAKAENCCAECKKVNGCAAFSWSNFNGGTCWLKSKKGQAVRSPGVRSATIKEDPIDPNCKLEEDTDYFDNDVKNVPATHAESCCKECKQVTGCRAFSWSNFNGGTCWLKSSKGRTIRTPGVRSAVVINDVPLPCKDRCLKGNVDRNGWAVYPDSPACWKWEGTYYSCFDKAGGKCPFDGMTECPVRPHDNPSQLCRGTCLVGNNGRLGWVSTYRSTDKIPPCWKDEGTYFSCFDYTSNGKCPFTTMTDCRNTNIGFCQNWTPYYCGKDFCFNPNHSGCCFDTNTHRYSTYWLWDAHGQFVPNGCPATTKQLYP